MSNPFEHWSDAMLQAHNERVAKGREVRNTVLQTQPSVDDVRRVRALDKSEQFAVTTGAASVPNTRQFIIHTDPVPAPRMTRRDKWLKPRRPCVQRYFDYRDTLQQSVGDLPTVPDELHCIFRFSMPESWSKKKREQMFGQPHRARPDRDNCEKAILDALFMEDGGVWKGSQEKFWADAGRVEITMIWR